MKRLLPTSVYDTSLLLAPGLCEIRLQFGYALEKPKPSFEDWAKSYSETEMSAKVVSAIVPFIVWPVSGKRILSDEGDAELKRLAGYHTSNSIGSKASS